MDSRYLISVFKGGKSAGLYYSADLAELPVIKALHRGCSIEVYRLGSSRQISEETITVLTREAYRRKLVMVKVIETGELFRSLRKCCFSLNLPYKYTYRAIKKGKAVKGYHLEYVEIDKDKDEE